MPAILAIETSTDACSVALVRGDDVVERCVVQPRLHNQIIFSLLAEVIDAGELTPENVAALAFGEGPGSFTGLRVASSAIQGLSFATGIGVVGVSTLAAQAHRALREGLVSTGDSILSIIDAKVGEVYAALYFSGVNGLEVRAGPWACPPQSLATMNVSVAVGSSDTLLDVAVQGLQVVGDGEGFVDQFPGELLECVESRHPHATPLAHDIACLAAVQLERGPAMEATEAQPVYVRDEISWKKLADQGRKS